MDAFVLKRSSRVIPKGDLKKKRLNGAIETQQLTVCHKIVSLISKGTGQKGWFVNTKH